MVVEDKEEWFWLFGIWIEFEELFQFLVDVVYEGLLMDDVFEFVCKKFIML